MARFKPGVSGNPKGRPLGSKHKATLAALALLEGDLEAITRKCIDEAKAGNLLAIKLVLDKLIPTAKDKPLALKLPPVEGAGGLPEALRAILEAVGRGEITPGEAQALAALLEGYRRGLELVDIEQRIKVLEEKNDK
jgi:hypothetical protein